MPKALIKIIAPAGPALALLSSAAWAQTPSDADRYAYGPHMGPRFRGNDDLVSYCPACLIAQDTATVIWSVSSPCATGAAAAMPAAILR
jgi:hypothetical protein